jgi:hypothetical protein
MVTTGDKIYKISISSVEPVITVWTHTENQMAGFQSIRLVKCSSGNQHRHDQAMNRRLIIVLLGE